MGMGADLYRNFTAARQVFAEVDDALGYALSHTIFDGPEEALRQTDVQQPAILAVSTAAWRVFRAERPHLPIVVGMGLSLGEYTAYVAAGVLSLAEGACITRLRGQAMQEAVPAGMGGMTAVLGLKASEVEDLCREVSAKSWVQPANYNAPGQIVVSGMIPGLEMVESLARDRGARVVRLSVSAPFHSRLLEPAGAILSKALAGIAWQPSHFPVLANVDGELCSTPAEIIPRLITQVSRPVRFQQSVEKTLTMAVDGFLEFGPGRSLTSLLKKIDRKQKVANVEDGASLLKALELTQGPGYNS